MVDRPQVGTAQIELLERLCNACAVSGDEGEVRAIVLEQIRPLADTVEVDALGNVLAQRLGKGENKTRVMLCAHMDEVGLMVTSDEGEGLFRFDTVGGINTRQLVGKPVLVGSDHVPGVIGAKPIHLTTADERSRAVPQDELRIDVSPSAGNKIKLGDRAAFATAFNRIGPSLCAKALDNRLGVAALIELFKAATDDVDLLAAFTVQEEVGLRGARVAAYALSPQLAIILDCTPALDLPSWESSSQYKGEDALENARYNTRLGAGPAIYISDRATLYDPRLISYLVKTAEAREIPYQFRQPGGGSTDAGAIHQQRTGIPSVSLSVPGRYLHSPAGIARLQDWEDTLALVYYALSGLPADILSGDR